jgi:AcrR family transcriptional regulator
VNRRDRKKQQTAEKIAGTALRLFAKRGFEAVTITEIAEAADVARGTLFSHFPTKESLVVAAVGNDDPAKIVADRAAGVSPVEALREHYRAFAANPGVDPDSNLLRILRVITDNPALSSAVNRLYDEQRDSLARVLATEAGAAEDDLPSKVAAAQICATILAIKSNFFHRLASGKDVKHAVKQLPPDVDAAFDLLEHGIGSLDRKKAGRRQKR